jgi:CMP-N-acetylneuraminic acid synthetase|tara:strand:- start:3357 stop:3629 length:273 start_codon:yes stop_codon:yes gene_type:complete
MKKKRITLKQVKEAIEGLENNDLYNHYANACTVVENLEKKWLDDEEEQKYICNLKLCFDMEQRAEIEYGIEYDRKEIDERIRANENYKRN